MPCAPAHPLVWVIKYGVVSYYNSWCFYVSNASHIHLHVYMVLLSVIHKKDVELLLLLGRDFPQYQINKQAWLLLHSMMQETTITSSPSHIVNI